MAEMTARADTNPFRRLWDSITGQLRFKIILPYAVLTLLLAVVGIFVAIRLAVGSSQERFVNQLIDAGRVVADEIAYQEEAHLAWWRDMAFTTGVDQAIVQNDGAKLKDLLFPATINYEIALVKASDRSGREVVSIKRPPQWTDVNDYSTLLNSGISLTDWQYLKDAARGIEDQFGDKYVAIQNTNAGHILYTVGPVKDPDDQVVGALLFGTYLGKLMEQVKLKSLADITFYDQQGNAFFTTLPVRSDSWGILNQEATLYQTVIAEPFTVLRDVELSERHYSLAFAPLQLRGEPIGMYSVALTADFIIQMGINNRDNLSLLFTGAMVLVIAVGLWISQHITKPIMQLAHASQAVTAGDLKQRVKPAGHDEIGVLGRTFNQMTQSLLERTTQLQEAAGRSRAILSSIADGVIVGDDAGKITLMNAAAEYVLEVQAEDFVGRPLRDLPGVFDYLQTVSFSQGSGADVPEGRQTLELDRKILDARFAPVITDNNQHIGGVVVFHDITREVESSRLKDEFIDTVSHELRTPLTVIAGYIELVMSMATEEQIEFLEIIRDHAQELITLIENLLDMSRIENGRIKLQMDEISVPELIDNTVSILQEEMDRSEINLQLNVSSDLPAIQGDYQRLSIALGNLISNAYKYSVGEGQVTVAASRRDESIQIDVTDTGVGISAEDQERLFTRFFRAYNELTNDVPGTGLGLHITKAIIETHGGSIWVESELNAGSTFSFVLPLQPPDTSMEDNREE